MQQTEMFPADEIQQEKNVVFSPCWLYRYFLRRELPGYDEALRKRIVFIMLNPSTADEIQNDPTVTRCINFAVRWGYNELVVLNIFALRSTDPKELYRAADPIGEDNDDWIKRIAGADGQDVVCAWGVHGAFNRRGGDVMNTLLLSTAAKVYVLGWTKDGHPKHPLYLKATTERIRVTC